MVLQLQVQEALSCFSLSGSTRPSLSVCLFLTVLREAFLSSLLPFILEPHLVAQLYSFLFKSGSRRFPRLNFIFEPHLDLWDQSMLVQVVCHLPKKPDDRVDTRAQSDCGSPYCNGGILERLEYDCTCAIISTAPGLMGPLP